MKTLIHMDSSGDTRIQFDDTEATEKAKAEAKALFERITQREGGAAFKLNAVPGQADEKITDFSQVDGETVLVPRVVGG